jgi:hypothetical protein
MSQYSMLSGSIIQARPEQGKHDARGWKTISGHDNESKRLAISTIRNGRGKWHVTLNIHHAFDIASVKRLWNQIARKLQRRHIDALWIREADRDSHINYHLLVASDISEDALRRAVKESVPAGVGFATTIRPIDRLAGLAWYICKAGKEYRRERLYFAEGVRLDKFGTIGNFWQAPKKDIWAGVIKGERELKSKLDGDPNIGKAAHFLSDLTAPWHHPKKLRRQLAKQPPDVVADLARSWMENEFGA